MADNSELKNLLSHIFDYEGGGLTEYESKQVVSTLGIPVPPGRLIAPQDLDHPDLAGLDGPFAVKFMSPKVQHKTEVGAVRTNVAPDQIAATCHRMAASPLLSGVPCAGFLVEEMASASAQEMVVGGLYDPTFGPVVMVGMGGVFLEVLNDVSFRICPVDASEVWSMLSDLRGLRLLEGYRGSARADLDALVEAVLAVAGQQGLLMSAYPTPIELDLNPLLVNEHGVVAVDAQIALPDSHSDGIRQESVA